MNKTTLLAPVGNWEMLVAAVKAGANAVYLGVKGINMRDRARNFDINELSKVTQYAHENKVEVYLTVNTIIFDEELKKIKDILVAAKKAKIDAIICWDLSVIDMCNKFKLNIHLSTQASVSNIQAIKKYYKLGVTRFVLARECSLEQIKEIITKAKKISKKIQIETFIHGAMCVSVSGRCFLSQFLYGDKTSANRGKCIQPCRRSYMVKDSETNKELKLENNYIMSPKDLCTIEFLDKLLDAKISVLKIEGRARSPEYVKVTTKAYRLAIDSYYSKKLNVTLKKKLVTKLKTVYNRGFSSGFYLGKPINEWTEDYGSLATKKKVFVGEVTKYFQKIHVAEIIIKTKAIEKGNNILIIGPTTGVHEQKVESMQLSKDTHVLIAEKGKLVGLKVTKRVRAKDKIYLFE